MVANEEEKLERRDDDEIINKPIVENRYNLVASFCELTFSHDTGNNISYYEMKDFEKSAFPMRKLIVNIHDKDIFKVMNLKKDKYGMFDVTLLVYFSDDRNLIKNKPFCDGKFKGIIKEGDVNISLRETVDEKSITKQGDGMSSIPLTIYLYREDEIDSFDDDAVNFFFDKGLALKDLLVYIFNRFTKYKFIISDPDHNPNTGRLLMPQVSIPDVMKLIDTDMGIYKTPYLMFLNEGILYFLNMDNDMKCRNPELEFSINVLMSKPGGALLPSTVDKLSNGNFTVVVGTHQVNISKSVSNKTDSSINYIYPNGSKSRNKNLSSRNIKTVRKFTNVVPLEKYKNLVRETIEVTLTNISFNKINPMSTLFFTDSQNKRREYRIIKSTILCEGRKSITIKIKAFRLIQENEEVSDK